MKTDGLMSYNDIIAKATDYVMASRKADKKQPTSEEASLDTEINEGILRKATEDKIKQLIQNNIESRKELPKKDTLLNPEL